MSTQTNAMESRFDVLLERARQLPPIPVAVCYPLTKVALAGALESASCDVIHPILVGPKEKIQYLAKTEGFDISSCEMIDAEDENQAAKISVELCRTKVADALMKGSYLHTDAFMHPVLAKETGLRTLRRISHSFVMETPAYDRILLITDAAINILPTLDDKADIVQNAIDLAHVLGVPVPKVAILSAVETVQSSIISTIHAAALCKMADRGQITGGILDGPLAFDTAVSPEAMKIKHLVSAVAGQADIVVGARSGIGEYAGETVGISGRREPGRNCYRSFGADYFDQPCRFGEDSDDVGGSCIVDACLRVRKRLPAQSDRGR